VTDNAEALAWIRATGDEPMLAEVSGPGIALAVLYPASLVFVVWAVADIIGQPTWRLSSGRKLTWLWPCVLEWLLLGGIVGGIVAVVYLVGVRSNLPPIRQI
jgi:hypothetical protein